MLYKKDIHITLEIPKRHQDVVDLIDGVVKTYDRPEYRDVTVFPIPFGKSICPEYGVPIGQMLDLVKERNKFGIATLASFLYVGNKFKGNPVEPNPFSALEIYAMLADLGTDYDKLIYAIRLVYMGHPLVSTHEINTGVEIMHRLDVDKAYLPAQNALARLYWTDKAVPRDSYKAEYYSQIGKARGGTIASYIDLRIKASRAGILKKIKIYGFDIPRTFRMTMRLFREDVTNERGLPLHISHIGPLNIECQCGQNHGSADL